MAELVYIKDFKVGSKIQGFYLVKSKKIRQAKNDRYFLDVTIQDKTGEMHSKQWDVSDDENEFDFNVGDAVAVRGRVDEYEGRLQAIIQNIRKVRATDKDYGYDPLNLVPSTAYDVDEMWEEIMGVIRTVTDDHIKELLQQIYKTYKEDLITRPASLVVHHAFRGGLLEHNLSLLKDCLYYAEKFEDLNRDFLIAGALLHDIGKVVELSDGHITEYTDEGNFIGHIVIGQNIVHDFIQKIPHFPREIQLQIEHMVLSHQGRYEWFSPKLPSTKEALVIHYLDDMDAKLNVFRNAVEVDTSENSWTGKNPYLQRMLYKKGT